MAETFDKVGREAVEQELAAVDFLRTQIESAEQRLEAIMKVSVETDFAEDATLRWKDSQHGSDVEIGRVDRFPTAAHLASYAGLVPRHAHMGQVCGNVNRNLKWAFVEIGNLVVVNRADSQELTWCGCISGSDAPRIIRRPWLPWGAPWPRQLGH